MDEDTIILLGNFCEEVTKHPLWVRLVEDFETAATQMMLATKPDQAKQREEIYATFNGARQLLNHFKAFVNAKHQILEARAIQQDAPEIEE